MFCYKKPPGHSGLPQTMCDLEGRNEVIYLAFDERITAFVEENINYVRNLHIRVSVPKCLEF